VGDGGDEGGSSIQNEIIALGSCASPKLLFRVGSHGGDRPWVAVIECGQSGSRVTDEHWTVLDGLKIGVAADQEGGVGVLSESDEVLVLRVAAETLPKCKVRVGSMFTEQGNGLNKGVGVLDSEPAPELRTMQDVTKFAEQVIGGNKTNPTGNAGFEETPRCSFGRTKTPVSMTYRGRTSGRRGGSDVTTGEGILADGREPRRVRRTRSRWLPVR